MSTPPYIAPVRFLRVILVLGACLHLTGGHYGVLQCIAWAGMLADYSSEDGLLEGARKTFDGEHPCGLCKSIAAAKQQDTQDRETAPPPGAEKLSLKDLKLPETVRLEAFRPGDFSPAGFVLPRGMTPLFEEGPPIPPPRVA